mgnify:CR=1 FL=1
MYSGATRNRWGRTPTPQDRWHCAGCDHFLFVNEKGEHFYSWMPFNEDGTPMTLGPCKAKENYNADDPGVA